MNSLEKLYMQVFSRRIRSLFSKNGLNSNGPVPCFYLICSPIYGCHCTPQEDLIPAERITAHIMLSWSIFKTDKRPKSSQTFLFQKTSSSFFFQSFTKPVPSLFNRFLLVFSFMEICRKMPLKEPKPMPRCFYRSRSPSVPLSSQFPSTLSP